MKKSLIAAVALVAIAGATQAQSPGTTPAETQRGVPGVDVDVGRNAKGAVDVNTNANRRERDRGVPGVDVDVGRNAQGAVDVDRTRAPRADRG
jgi:hypothetical protein